MIRPRAAWRSGPAGPLVAVLLLMLALTGFLAYQAWDAAGSHRRVTEAALRDYAGFAAWELRRRVESRANAVLNAAIIPALAPIIVGRGELDVPPDVEMTGFVLAVQSELHACGCVDAVSDYFLLDLDSQSVELREARLGPAFREWLTGGFLEHVRLSGDATAAMPVRPSGSAIRREIQPGRMLVLQRRSPAEDVFHAEAPVPFDSSRVVVYTAAPRGADRRIVGFVLDVPDFVRPLIEDAFANPPLLPLSLTDGARNDELLSTTVWTASGDTLFRAGDAYASTSGVVDTFRLATGTLEARVAVQPKMAAHLVIGGLPRSRVPVLLGSVGLTLALLVIAVAQLRRQQELFRLRADFVSGVSHELRTPLAQIRLFADLLASGRLDEDRRHRSIRILTDEAKRLSYLVENVLRFSRSERQTERIAPVALEVAPLLREIADDFAPLARFRDSRIVVDAPDGLRAPLDADGMRQVMLNLLDNAVKYGPRGQRIDVRALREEEWLRIEVDDEGPGIPAAERERIWEPYRRLSRDVEASTGGSGIGLAVVRQLVALHGGEVLLTDAPGGSRFVLRLPGAEPPGAAAAARVPVGASQGSDA